ncbi:hypothetical protein SAMN05192560_1520 [Methylobacillus rhizosphaerae]|uniref:Uncharacterized protein n=1 Tax=Methylobacillus rhizosphaerae TaxID=551994 RepID=A0A238ZVP8_9PROT|nr:hypothetical protein [Methylobacillus rhizosphaerae]SNR87526.1 hypothetical protein SAMN05192560_1520 [Methylobacillus rhizosphaerae]
MGHNIEQSIHDLQHSIEVLQALKEEIETRLSVLTVEEVLGVIARQIHAASQQKHSFSLAKKLDAHLPDPFRAPLVNT